MNLPIKFIKHKLLHVPLIKVDMIKEIKFTESEQTDKHVFVVFLSNDWSIVNAVLNYYKSQRNNSSAKTSLEYHILI